MKQIFKLFLILNMVGAAFLVQPALAVTSTCLATATCPAAGADGRPQCQCTCTNTQPNQDFGCRTGQAADCDAACVSFAASSCNAPSVCVSTGTNCPSGFQPGPQICSNAQTCCNPPYNTPTVPPAPNSGTPVANPIVPKLQVSIPGVSFSGIKETTTGNNRILTVPFIAEYIVGIFKYLIAIAGFLATIMVMISGIQWMVSGGNSKNIAAARDRIKKALLGLGLALASYTLLFLVNPVLVKPDALNIQSIAEVPTMEEDDDPGDVVTGPLCTGAADCKAKVCQSGYSVPKSANKSVVTIPKRPGVENYKNQKAAQDVLDKLSVAGRAAQDQGYLIVVTSGYRSLEGQVALACQAIAKGEGIKLEKGFRTIAWPGTSNHGSGSAIDIILSDGKEDLTCAGDTKVQNNCKQNLRYSPILTKIMLDAGFKRLQSEIWHFESNTTSPCLCTDKCAQPPNMYSGPNSPVPSCIKS